MSRASPRPECRARRVPGGSGCRMHPARRAVHAPPCPPGGPAGTSAPPARLPRPTPPKALRPGRSRPARHGPTGPRARAPATRWRVRRCRREPRRRRGSRSPPGCSWRGYARRVRRRARRAGSSARRGHWRAARGLRGCRIQSWFLDSTPAGCEWPMLPLCGLNAEKQPSKGDFWGLLGGQLLRKERQSDAVETILLFGATEEGAEHVPLEDHHEGIRSIAGVVGDER